MRHMLTTGALMLGMAGSAFAETSPDLKAELEALKAQVKQQSQEIHQLRNANGESWMTQRRAEEIKTLIHEVLSDADTRASLAEGGVTAGWRDGFYLTSEDNNFLLRVSGQGQIRYVYNSADNVFRPTTRPADEDVSGFEIRRAKLRFAGHLFDPKFTYAIQLNVAYGNGVPAFDDIGSDAEVGGPGDIILEDAFIGYEFADGWQVKLGQFKAPFSREELVDSKYQLAAERSYTNDYYTIDRTQGVQLSWTGDLCFPVRLAAMIHDGSYMANSEFHSDLSDFAIAARGEVLLAGDWAQFDDYAAWSGQPFALMLGAGIDYEEGETGMSTAGIAEDVFKYTADANVEVPDFFGFNAMAAFYGQNVDHDLAVASEQWGIVGQAGAFVIPDKLDAFIRYEYIDFDEHAFHQNAGLSGFSTITGVLDDDHLNILTVGSNYYFQKHAAKATLDLQWVMDPIPFSNSGAGISSTDDGVSGDAHGGDQYVLRAQFQFLF